MLGVDGEKALVKELHDKTGIPAVAGGACVSEALRSLGVKKMSIYVPTNEQITKMTVTYFQDQGFNVRDCEALGEESIANINRMSPWELYSNIVKLYRRSPDVDGIFVTGGCFRILEVAGDPGKGHREAGCDDHGGQYVAVPAASGGQGPDTRIWSTAGETQIGS